MGEPTRPASAATDAVRHGAEAGGERPPRPGMVWIAGGAFRMGSDRFYPEERPVREVRVAGFWIDRHPVTNQQFSRFMAATGYRTVAERAPDPALYPGAPTENLVAGSMVFIPTAGPVDLGNAAQWWAWTPGADWRHPRGPRSSIAGLGRRPVVHVALEDVEAYCAWAGAALPTEAEWEYAARGGLDQAIFTWGDDERPQGRFMANTWQGQFPWRNTKDDGYVYTSPVGSFPANGYGLLDMAGNVWEWTGDWYAVAGNRGPSPSCCIGGRPDDAREASVNPAAARFRIPRKVVKGGSHLCAPSYCFRYRPAARQPQDIDTGMSHVGFRCVVRPRSTD
jgi:formylglycine-generating enzyme required for sulfatase activity